MIWSQMRTNVAIAMAAEKKHSETDLSPQKASPSKDRLAGLIENLKLIAIALMIAAIVRVFIAEPRYIPSPSMVPTLSVGDRLLVDKISYRFHAPKPGDIVIFEPPPQLQEYGYSTKQAFIKRVVGLPGQTVEVDEGVVLVDDKPVVESYTLEPPHYEMPAVRVPPNNLFVMGDNRNDSNDSHVWGFLPVDNVIGRAAFRFWPLPRLGLFD